MGSRHQSGLAWEAAARDYFAARGLQILEQRYRCKLGELDLVCRDGTTIVVVEVRARSRSSYASALESIDWHKRRKIVSAARHLLMRHPEWSDLAVRFDVLAIDDIDKERPRVEWIRNAFEC